MLLSLQKSCESYSRLNSRFNWRHGWSLVSVMRTIILISHPRLANEIQTKMCVCLQWNNFGRNKYSTVYEVDCKIYNIFFLYRLSNLVVMINLSFILLISRPIVVLSRAAMSANNCHLKYPRFTEKKKIRICPNRRKRSKAKLIMHRFRAY